MTEQDKAPEQQSDAFSSALNGILGNPEMMSMISSMAQKLKGSDEQKGNPAPKPQEESVATGAKADIPEAISALAPILSGLSGNTSKSDNDRACLLRALKPYLSQGRCEAIDNIIKFSRISDLLKNLS